MSENRKTDVFGVGNAIVDTITFVDDDFIREHELQKGGMTLVDADRQASLLHGLEHHAQELRSGGSAANTMFAVALSGGSAFYSGKVSKDPNGEFYRQDLLKAGIHFDIHPAQAGATGTCVVMTTADAERTMCTHLGVSTTLSANDIDPERIKQCKLVYMEGYLWDAETPRAACVYSMEQARAAGTRVSFTMSDSFLVDRYHADFREVMREYVDVIFCNRAEACAFAETNDLEAAARVIGALTELAFVTNSEHGCLVVRGGTIETVAGFPVKPIDTNGAGDAFAGGVLFGLAYDYSPAKAARWGNYLASRVVLQPGPRLEESVTHRVAEILDA